MNEEKTNKWISSIDEKTYEFNYRKAGLKHILTINDEDIIIKRKSTSIFVRLDEPFVFDGKEARLVKMGKEVDVVYNDFYLQSGEKYYATPKWVYLFVGLCLLLPTIAGGRLHILLAFVGLLGTFLYRFISRKKIHTFVNTIIVLIIIIQGIFLPIFFGLAGSYLCVRASRGDGSTSLKIVLCTIMTFMVWLLFSYSLLVITDYITPLIQTIKSW